MVLDALIGTPITMVGTALGAQIGTLVCPVFGTLIGAGMGYYFSKQLKQWIVEDLALFIRGLHSDQAGKLIPYTQNGIPQEYRNSLTGQHCPMKGHSGDHLTVDIEIKLTQPAKVFTNVRDLIDHYEGCPLKAYKDEAGVWTIGRGHTDGVYEGMEIT